jgi:hypothetical protein
MKDHIFCFVEEIVIVAVLADGRGCRVWTKFERQQKALSITIACSMICTYQVTMNVINEILSE